MLQDPVLALTLRPGVRSLTSVISVLHARAADVTGLDYSRCADAASLTLRCSMSEAEAELLVRQLARRIDVLSAVVQTPRGCWLRSPEESSC